MTTATRSDPDRRSSGDLGVPVASGVAGGTIAHLCWSVGVVAVATWAVGINTAFFALDRVSPVGSRPILVLIGLVITLLLTWVLMRRRVRGLPSGVARSVMRRGIIVALFSGALTYFVLMQIVMPLLFLFGVNMGGFFPPGGPPG